MYPGTVTIPWSNQPVPMPRRPHRCPICKGKGIVPAGFYSLGGVSTSTNPERCRACNGQGIVIA